MSASNNFQFTQSKNKRNACRHVIFLITATITALIGSFATAQVVTVTTSADVTDVSMNAMMNDLPGPDGVVSLREALRVSDNEPGQQTIGFAIPEDDWYLADLFPGLCLIQGSSNWLAFDTVTIDGTTQTDFTGDTNPEGNEVVLYGLPLIVNGDNSLIFGLDSSNVVLNESNNCMVTGNTGDMNIEMSVGAGNMISDNEADTIEIAYSNFNVVVANTTQRVRIYGGGPLFGLATGNQIGGPDLADRNFITGWGNYGEHGFPAGTTLDLNGTDQTLIENNYIGTTPNGLSIGNQASTTGIGIFVDNSNVTIRNNLLAIHAVHASGSGDFGAPIYIDGYEGANNIHIFGNTLGLNANDEPVLGGLHGIWVNDLAFQYATGVRIGGTEPGQGNIIAGHASTGILMEGSPGLPPISGIRVSGNSIYANGEIGIDLMPNTWDFGHTDNDPLDADIGANCLQNYPVILSATNSGQMVDITGQLHSQPASDFTVEFFASSECDPSGFGQGKIFVGSTSVSTDDMGDSLFDVSLAASVPDGWVLSSTATLEPTGATSEFSACLTIESTIVYGDVNLDEEVNLLDVRPFVDLLTNGLFQVEADINRDGTVDLLDVAGFVELLTG